MSKFTIEEIKQETDLKCGEINKDLFFFKKDLHGKEVRDKILELTSNLTRFSELCNNAKLKYNLQQAKVDIYESHAMDCINNDTKLSKVPVSMKQYYLESYEIKEKYNNSDDVEITTLNKEKEILAAYEYAVNRFKSIYEDIKIAIISCQSVLNFDREELRNLSSSDG